MRPGSLLVSSQTTKKKRRKNTHKEEKILTFQDRRCLWLAFERERKTYCALPPSVASQIIKEK